jgi:tetratricopeptide (TPR) repeat protein
VKLHWPISAGEFFELLRPAALLLSALLSAWVLASTRRRHFRLLASLAWATGTFFLPLIVFPIYLVVILFFTQTTADALPKFRYALPFAYAVGLLSLVSLYLYTDYKSVDAHLARAAQAKVMNQRARAIREYEAALRIEDNPHTHKLLGVELADEGDWSAALRELRAAESGGEPDDALAFMIGRAFEATGQPSEARNQFEKFLNSRACKNPVPDSRCENARTKLAREN